MAIFNGIAIPNTLVNGQAIDAPKLMGNFNTLLAALNAALMAPTPGSGANAGGEQLRNIANGTISTDAVSLGQIAGYAALAGAVFTGAVSMPSLVLTTTPLALSSGGVGSATAAGARTNLGAAASGANADITSLLESTLVASGGAIASNSIGFRGVPFPAVKTVSYGFVLTDSAIGAIFNSATLTATIPANGTIAFPIGTILPIVNINASPLTIAITTDTLHLAGTATVGNRTLAQWGWATAEKVSATDWVISGPGLT